MNCNSKTLTALFVFIKKTFYNITNDGYMNTKKWLLKKQSYY